MKHYGSWDEKIAFDGHIFGADLIDPQYADRSGFNKIYAINGLPSLFEQNLIRSSQVSDVPHTWRVQECQSETEVTEEILKKGKEVLDKDIKDLGTHIITYLAQNNGSNHYEFLAAGSIRNKLSRNFEDNQFPVVSRAIVTPKHRGKGLGTMIVEHRMTIVLGQYFGNKPKAIHFGTESKKILHAIQKVEQAEGIKFVYIGDEKYAASDGTHTVHDFLCFLPWYRDELLAACESLKVKMASLELVEDFIKKLDQFTKKGIDGIIGTQLESLYKQIAATVKTGKYWDDKQIKKSLDLLDQLFLVKHEIGAADPN